MMFSIRKALVLIAGILTITSAVAANARAIEEKNIVSGKDAIAADKGYIYLFAPGRFAGTFIRQPDAEDIATYRAQRAEAFAKEVERYQKRLKRWESDVAAAKKVNKAPPPKPEEPQEETFAYGAIEQTTTVSFGPDYVFSKDREAGRFAYLTEVKPGRYVWYGPVLFDSGQGYIGVCYCMGSIQFEVQAGVITDLGNYLIAAPRAEDQASAPLLDIQHSGGWNGFKVELPTQSSPFVFGMPQSLERFSTEQPEFSAAGKMNNFCGVMISRLPSIDGILAYRRDAVIDVRTGQELSVGVTPE